MLHRPTSAPVAATNGIANNNKVEQNQNDESFEESLDSLHSSKSMESLDVLPPFSPLTPLGTPSVSNRRLWKSSSRSSASVGGGSSNKTSSPTGKNNVDNSNGKSKMALASEASSGYSSVNGQNKM